MQPDSNLLFGILAVQLHMASPQQLVAAGTVLASTPGLALGDILIEQGVLAPRDRELLDELLAWQMTAAHGDASQVYASCGGDAAARASFTGSLALGSLVDAGGQTEVLVAEQPGRYSLRKEQGRGASGRVLIAFDETIHREIALKELLPGIAGGCDEDKHRALLHREALTARFLREARITGQLEHPGIVPVYELGQRADGAVYYTMKLVRGATLADKLKTCRNLSDRMVLLNHFLDLCQAIAYAHSRGVIHRDIKPANVMVGEFGETVLVDWGLVKVQGQVDEGAEKLASELRLLKDASAGESVAGKPVGTPSYMPPEQAEGRIAEVDERSDVWSLGAVLYELLTGRPPFTGDSALKVVKMVQKDEVQPVLDVCKEAPPELAAVAMRCLKRDPQARYQEVEQLAQEIVAFQTGGLVSAYAYNAGKILIRWAVKHWPVLMTAGVALTMLLAMGALAYVQIVKQRNVALAANQRLDSKNNELMVLRLASESHEQLAHGQTKRASLLALQAVRFNGRINSIMPEVDSALREAVAVPQQYQELLGHSGDVLSVAVSPDGQLLASASADATIRLWNMAVPGTAPRVLRGHAGAVNSVAFSSKGGWLASAGHDKTVQLWKLTAQGDGPRILLGHSAEVNAVAFSPDGKLLASGSNDTTIRIWDLTKPGQNSRVLLGHRGRVASVAFAPEGRQLATSGYDGLILLWDIDAPGKPARALHGHQDCVYDLAFSPDGKLLASACVDHTIQLLELAAPARLPRVLHGHTNAVLSVAFSPDSRFLASGSLDEAGMIRLWDLTQPGRAPRILHGQEFGVKSLVFTPDGKKLATGSMDSAIRLWDLAAPEWSEPRILHNTKADLLPPTARPPSLSISTLHNQLALSVAFSPDGKQLAVGQGDHRVRLWSLDNLTATPRILPGQWGSTSVTFSPDGRLLVAGNPGLPMSTINIWNLSLPKAMPRRLHWDSAVYAFAFSPDGRYLAFGTDDMRIGLLDIKTPESAPRILHGHTDRVKTVAISPDGTLLASGGWDNSIRIWEMARLDAAPRELSCGTSSIHCVDFSPDGRFLASANSDKLVRIWDLSAAGAAPRILTGHRSFVLSVAFSPDGQLLASASNDLTIRLWHMADLAAEPSILYGHEDRVNSVAFSPDGTLVASAGCDGTVRLWRTQVQDIIEILQDECYRNLTQAEWDEYIGPSYPYESTIPSLPPGPGASGGPPMEPIPGLQ